MITTEVPISAYGRLRGPGGITTAYVNVTPDLAREWLEHNTHNRRPRPRSIKAYADDMAAGQWALNGDAIKFADDGTLLDGQNRLMAVVTANVAVVFEVKRGLSRATQETMDTGTRRTFADVLKLREVPQATTVAAIVRIVRNWEFGGRGIMQASRQWTAHQLSETLDANPHIVRIAREAHRVSNHVNLSGSHIGFCMWLFEPYDVDDSDEFFARLGDGQGLIKGDPIYELRAAVNDPAMRRGVHRSPSYLLAITIKAWNAYRDGRDIAFLRFRPGGAKPEVFPEPH